MTHLNKLRKFLALPRTSWQLCLLAIVGGTMSALLVVLFVSSVEYLQQLYLNQRENYNSLDSLSRFELPIIGALLILAFAWFTGYQYLRTGIPFVLHRLKSSHGVIPFRNTFNQFFGSVIALASGFSVGREGPAVHLGAACSSYLGSKLKLPHNAIRTLCACGIAAAIAACFNTPIAAVIFVMEVILREYKVHIFIPVMMAAIVGSMITSSILGPAHEFEYFTKITITVSQYPVIFLLGIILGILAFIFNKYLVTIITLSKNYHIAPRLLLAALITAGLGYFVPAAMGTDVGSVYFSTENTPTVTLLIALLVAKVIMTITALGLGIPGGIVGPILGIGAIAGTLAATIAAYYFPGQFTASDYALMGMAGFMAATLNAPLAALLAVVELSNQIEIIVPTMMVITASCLSSGQFFKNRSVFIMQLEAQNLSYRKPPIEKSLQRIGVFGVMNSNLCHLKNACPQTIKDQLNLISQKELVINECAGHFIWHEHTEKSINEHVLIPLSFQATLAEAYLALLSNRQGGVYIYQHSKEEILGVVTFEQIRSFLLEGKTQL